ncbi:MAG: ABC transporter permease subunit [Ignisphaera sp.]
MPHSRRATKAMDASTLHIVFHCIAREAMSTAAVLSIYSFPEALSIEISLNFIGLGIQPPIPSIGSMLAEGVRYVAVAPHIIVPPTVAVFITILVADTIREN